MNITVVDEFSSNFNSKLTPFGIIQTEPDKSTEILIVRSKTKVGRAYMENLPNLKLILRGGVGVDTIDLEAAKEKGIIVKNTPLASAIAVAEITFALMISIPCCLIEGHTSMSQGQWIKNALKRTELFGKTICLIGIGNIATEMAKRCKAFGMNVVVYRKSGKPSDYADVKKDFGEAVKDADYISLHVPLTDETRGMINSKAIAKMKDGVFIVNTARGKCVVQQDLLDALESGKVRAYAADVWEIEPPDESAILVNGKNVIMTPHLGSSTKENLERIENELVKVISDFKEGKLSI